MAKFEYDGTCLEVLPFPVTLRHNTLAREWLDRVNHVAASEAVASQQSKIIRAVNNWPEMLEYIDKNGQLNTVAIERHERAIRRQTLQYWEEKQIPESDRELTDEEVRRQAEERVQMELQNLVLANPEIAKLLYFSQVEYPETMTALLAGIECIRATCDRTKLNEFATSLIDSPLDSEFWQNRNASEVAEYVNLFRERFK